MIVYQLTRPASYLTIKDPSKWKMDWGIPVIITLVVSGVLYAMPGDTNWVGVDGLIDNLQGFLQILPGFYLASLAAIATFNKTDLDYELPEPTPSIAIKFIRAKQLHKKTILLTRRRMLCYLFGYLTFLSLMLYLLTVFAPVLANYFSSSVSQYVVYISYALKILFQLFFWQMIVVTIFGLYQLCDRIHQVEDPN
jgi:hypothetical protein